MISRRTGAAALGAAAACALGWACLKPTQITLHVTTDVDCAVVVKNGASIYGNVAANEAPITTTKACDAPAPPRSLGTFVLTPSGGKDDAIGFSVVAGVTRPSEQCAANDFAGCIVARRRIRYVAHEPLDLPIDLSLACLDVKCRDGQTCSSGRCITSDVDDPNFACTGRTCGDPPLNDASASADSGAQDAGASDAAVGDAAPIDAGANFLMSRSNNKSVYGLAVDADALYWVQNVGGPSTPAYQLFREPWSKLPDLAAAQPLLGSLAPGPLAGLAVDSTAAWVAGRTQTVDCYGSVAIDGGFLTGYGCPAAQANNALGIGITRSPDAAGAVAVTLSAGPPWVLSDGGSTNLPDQGFYAEYEDPSHFVMATGFGFVEVTVTTSFVPTVTVTLPTQTAQVRGIAVSNRDIYASDTSGTIYVRSRANPGIDRGTLHLGNALTGIEDLAYHATSTTTGDLFVATAQGIYWWPNIDSYLTP